MTGEAHSLNLLPTLGQWLVVSYLEPYQTTMEGFIIVYLLG